LLLDENLVSSNIERISRYMENLTPEHTFEFEILISGREKRLLRVLVSVNFIKNSVVNQLT